MLKRRIRSEVEAWLADAMLRDDVKPGDRIRLTYDPDKRAVMVEPKKQKKMPVAA